MICWKDALGVTAILQFDDRRGSTTAVRGTPALGPLHLSDPTSLLHVGNVAFVPILLQKWEMRESKRRLGVEARFWLPLAPLGAVASKQLH